ncbi:hypothetical protein SLE2022_115790 [Rubroshorea leprosula]
MLKSISTNMFKAFDSIAYRTGVTVGTRFDAGNLLQHRHWKNLISHRLLQIHFCPSRFEQIQYFGKWIRLQSWQSPNLLLCRLILSLCKQMDHGWAHFRFQRFELNT